MNYNFKPISLKTANDFVSANHRHNKSSVGDKFRVGLFDGDSLIGIGQAGRPVARMLDDGKTLEITRVCVLEGYKNACSMIYARLVKIAKLMGYKRIITYTLTDESGASLRALGARQVGFVRAGEWSCPSRPRKSQDIYQREKIKWEI